LVSLNRAAEVPPLAPAREHLALRLKVDRLVRMVNLLDKAHLRQEERATNPRPPIKVEQLLKARPRTKPVQIKPGGPIKVR
jgi:hypothetical protein